MSVTFDPGTVAGAALTGGNLTATNTGTTATNQGAKVASSKSSGKWYFEIALTTKNSPPGADFSCGVAVDADSFTDAGFNVTNASVVFLTTGNIWRNGSNSTLTLGARAQADVIGIAVDLANHLAWFRVGPSGNWNGQAIGSQNPVGAVGGVTVTSAAGVEPYVMFGGTSGTSGNALTLNPGSSSFSGAIPTGFTSWDGSQSAIAVILPPALLQNRIAL